MSKRIINAQVFKTDSFESWRHEESLTLPKSPVNADASVEGPEYFQPVVQGGIVARYTKVDVDEIDANTVTTVRLRDQNTGAIIFVLGTVADWVTRANECCDGVAGDMPTVVLTEVAIQEEPCGEVVISESSPAYEYYAQHSEAIIVGQKLTLVGKNAGVAFAPAAPGAGFANVAAALAWAQANWGAYGVFSAVGTTGIKLSSTTVTKGELTLALQDVTYCLTIAAAQVFNQVKNGATTFNLPAAITVVDADQVIPLIKDYFADGTLTKFSATKIQYVGKNVPGGTLQNGVAVANFAAGACV